MFVIAAITAAGEVENTEKQPVAAELVGNTAIDSGNPKKQRGITDQNFISPLFGRDDPLDFVLDEVFISLL